MACSGSCQVMPVWPILRRLVWAFNVTAPTAAAAATFAKFRRLIPRDIFSEPFIGDSLGLVIAYSFRCIAYCGAYQASRLTILTLYIGLPLSAGSISYTCAVFAGS